MAAADHQLPSKPSPCLMLPTAFKNGDVVHTFYSPAEDRTLTFRRRLRRIGATRYKKSVDSDAVVVGSGHGWLATFNAAGNRRLFLSNLISGDRIKLPPMIPTPIEFFLGPANKLWNVKIVLSSSPDEEECRAVMAIHGLGLSGLAYCRPGRCSVWVPLCGLQTTETNFVYSSRQQCFIAISTPQRIAIESWDLRHHPQPPRMLDLFKDEINFDYRNCPWSIEEIGRHQEMQYVALQEDTDDLYIVRRLVDFDDDFDGSYKTFGFLVFKVERERRKATYTPVGPTMFLGTDQSYALPNSEEFPLIKPNSVYFTIPTSFDLEGNGQVFVDVGIYDYGQRIMSSKRCPFDVEGVGYGYLPGPVWFTPRSP